MQYSSDGMVEKKYKNENIAIKKVESGFTYNSGSNEEFLNVTDLREMIRKHINNEFVAR